MQRTLDQYDAVVAACRKLFLQKTQDYGTAWRILRPASLTDQLFIKAKRIRNLEETGRQQVADGVGEEYVGLVNYSFLALMQLELPADAPLELTLPEASRRYDEAVSRTRELMIAKNHDYGEVWRDMRVSSLTDLILMKLLRIKQIENNEGRTVISEGVDANYMDIANYAIFALIRLEEENAADIPSAPTTKSDPS